MTKIIFIISALFLISIVLKSNIERPVQATKPKLAESVILPDEVDEVSSDLNELLASEQSEAGPVETVQTKQANQATMTVKEELVNVAKLESAFSNDKVEKLVQDLSSTATASTASVASKTAPIATSAPAVAPAAVPLVSNVSNAGNGVRPSSSTNTTSNPTSNRQSASNTHGAIVPVAPSPRETQSKSEGTTSKMAETSGKYYVQYGIFSSACRCEQVKDKLSQAGIESLMDKLDPEGKQWIVKSKPYSSRAEAINHLQAAQRKGYESYLVAAN